MLAEVDPLPLEDDSAAAAAQLAVAISQT